MCYLRGLEKGKVQSQVVHVCARVCMRARVRSRSLAILHPRRANSIATEGDDEVRRAAEATPGSL